MNHVELIKKASHVFKNKIDKDQHHPFFDTLKFHIIRQFKARSQFTNIKKPIHK